MANEPRREQPTTYFVEDHANREELARLHLQDQMLTIGMGGVLPEQTDPERFQRVLDVGCGTGGWLIEVARCYPGIRVLMGVDANVRLLASARTQAEVSQVSDRVQFQVMDVLRMLEYPDASFDLVNQRSAVSYLRTWDWPKLLDEYQRVLCSGGVLRITEPELVPTCSSPALTQLFALLLTAFAQAGHLFVPQSDGLTSVLPDLLTRYGFRDVGTRLVTLVQRAGTPEAEQGYETIKALFHTAVPFLQKWSRLPETYSDLYQQALEEMRDPTFVSTSRLLTVWGTYVAKAGTLS